MRLAQSQGRRRRTRCILKVLLSLPLLHLGLHHLPIPTVILLLPTTNRFSKNSPRLQRLNKLSPLATHHLCPSELLPHFSTLHSLPSSYLLSLPPHHHWKISKFFPLLSSDAHAILLLRRKEVVLSEILRGVLGMAARLLQRDPHGSVSRWS